MTPINARQAFPQGILYIILIFWAAVQIFPILFMLMTSLKTDAEIMRYPWALPSELNFSNYWNAWLGGSLKVPFSRYFVNSVIVVTSTLAAVSFLGSLAAYGLARFHFLGNGLLNKSLIIALAIPIHATLIPIFNLTGSLGLRNSYLGLILVYTAFWLPFSIMLLTAFFKGTPASIEESAKIDGCTDFGAYFRIALPLSKGAIASVSIVNFVGLWSELLFSFILMNKQDMKTVTSGIFAFRGEYTIDWGMTFAALSIISFPTILFFLFFQRQIIRGMAVGALKG